MLKVPCQRTERFVELDGTVKKPICIRRVPSKAECLVLLRTTARTGKRLNITSRIQVGDDEIFQIDATGLRRGVDYDTRGSGTMPSRPYVLGRGVATVAHVIELKGDRN